MEPFFFLCLIFYDNLAVRERMDTFRRMWRSGACFFKIFINTL